MSVLSFNAFIPHLIKSVPELIPLYDEHINEYDEMLEHVFLGEVTRFIESSYKSKNKSYVLNRIFELFDSVFNSEDEKLVELISVSFLENLTKDDEDYRNIKNMLSRSMQNELRLYE